MGESRLRRAGFVALAAAFGFWLATFALANDDTGFHIATGRWISARGEVPALNPFSYAEDGAHWLQHQWRSAVVIAWLVAHVGVPGLVLAKAGLVALLVGLLAWSASRRAALATVALLLAVALAAAAWRFKVRPYLFSALALGVTTAALQAFRERGGRGALTVAVGTPALALLLHAGGLHSLLVWAAAGAAALLPNANLGAPEVAARPPGRAFVLAAAAAAVALALASLLVFAPDGLAVLALPARFSADGYWNRHLAEFRPLGAGAIWAPAWLALGVGVALLPLAFRARRVFEALLLLGFGALALRHVRMILPFAVVLPLAGAAIAGDSRAWPASWRGRLGDPLHARRLTLGVAALALLVAAWAAQTQAEQFRMGVDDGAIDRRVLPVELLDRARALPEQTFVSDGFAGTWLWRNLGAPGGAGAFESPQLRHRVLVHNCLECYEPATYIERYQAIRYAKPGWQAQVQALGIRSFVLKYTSAGERRLQQGQPNVRQALFADPAWLLVDFDDVAAMYVHRDARPADLEVLADFPVDPDSGSLAPGTAWPTALAALRNHADAHPTQTRALLLLGHLAARHGDVSTLARAAHDALLREPHGYAARTLADAARRLAGQRAANGGVRGGRVP
ncbi:MAG: hypothetical protein RIT45_323 [Pseudomonadota bacterium]|jgi:hypothetical protein